jgi:ATP-dependent Clp protease ATP-binding subunit ClpC
MFERYTDAARRTLFFARYETAELGGMTIEAEHLLLALLRADKGPTPHLFAVADLSYAGARAKIREHLSVREQVPGSVELPFSQHTERILQYATDEADRLDHKYIGTGHLLAGILGEGGSFAAGILRTHGMSVENVRRHVATPLPTITPEQAPEAPAEHDKVFVMPGASGGFESLEQIRWLAEELGRLQAPSADTRILLDQIHYHLDALKQHLARM